MTSPLPPHPVKPTSDSGRLDSKAYCETCRGSVFMHETGTWLHVAGERQASPLPTDEDREALFKALAGIVEEGIDHRDAVDAVLAAGFRRSVVSTPLGTLDEPQGTLHDAADRVAGWIERLDAPAAMALEADDLRRLVDHALAVSAPPTITDEMVERAAKAILDGEGITPDEAGGYWSNTWDYAVKDARAALRAALGGEA